MNKLRSFPFCYSYLASSYFSKLTFTQKCLFIKFRQVPCVYCIMCVFCSACTFLYFVQVVQSGYEMHWRQDAFPFFIIHRPTNPGNRKGHVRHDQSIRGMIRIRLPKDRNGTNEQEDYAENNAWHAMNTREQTEFFFFFFKSPVNWMHLQFLGIVVFAHCCCLLWSGAFRYSRCVHNPDNTLKIQITTKQQSCF